VNSDVDSQDDWQAIGEIQAECYHALAPEPLHVLKSKWQASPQTCYVLEKSDQVVGYCLAHPWTEDTPPPLYKAITTLPKADTLYLHDIAISNRAQGFGAGRKLFDTLKLQAEKLRLGSLSLVAVQGACGYWEKLGFNHKRIEKSLATYTDDASYMVYPVAR